MSAQARNHLVASILFALCSASAVSTAQAQDEKEANDGRTLEEVVVTATRMASSLQDIPLSVTALSALDMERRNIGNTRDLQASVPNLSIAANTGTASGGRIFIRGIGDDESRVGADSAVAAYVDDVYLGRQTGALLELLDLERIEVLRGPQGTLYGRNATGGALKYVSRRPDVGVNELDLYATVGNFSRLDGKAVGNFAIGDNTAVRASVMSRNQDGAFIAWSDGESLGDIESLSGRIAIQHDFSNDWSLYAAFDTVSDDTQPIPTSIPEGFDSDNNVYTLDPASTVDCTKPTQAPWSGCFEDYSSEVESSGATMDISGPIGNFTFRSLTGYREIEDDLNSNFGTFNYLQQTDQDQFSQEFTLTSGFDGPFNFVSGLYYFDEDANLDYVFALPATINVQTEAWAIFGEGTYAFSESWELRAGLRYTDETKDMSGRSIFFTDVLGRPGFSRTDHRSFDSTDYRLALQYYVQPVVMLFGSFTTGFKSGGDSPDCFSPLPVCMNPVEPESVDTWEIGMRSELLDNSLRLNVTYFDNTYDDLQLGGSTPRGFIRYNVPEVQTNGVEVEWTYLATDALSFDGYVAYSDGSYTELDATSVVAIGGSAPNPICGGEIPDADCIKNNFELKNLPDWNYAIAGNYSAGVGNGYELFTRVNVAYEDDSFTLVGNTPEVKRESTTIVDARISLINPSDTWSVSLWGKNLTDEVYYPAATTVGRDALGVVGLVFAAMPRTYGVDLRYTFN